MGLNIERLANLVKLAQGDRTLNQFARNCNIDAGNLSRIVNGRLKNAPKPDTLKKISQYASNNVTYEQLLLAAGYINDEDDIEISDIKTSEKDLTPRDLKDIEKDLEKMIEEIQTNPDSGFAPYNGQEISEDDMELMKNAFKTALMTVKKINKEKYTPKKFKRQ